MKTVFILISLIFIITSCKRDNPSIKNNLITSEGINIREEEIEQSIIQELYEKLYEIYLLRKSTIDSQIRLTLMKTHKEDAFIPMDSIISKYKIQINLKEPQPPYIPIKDIDAYFNGNLKSTITILEIINPECDLCNIVSQRIKPLYEEYKTKIKFGHILYTKDNAFSSQALLYALQKNKYENLYTNLISLTQIDTTTVYNEMKKLKLDIYEFNQQLPYLQKRTLKTNMYIQQQGINKTPTLLINNRLVYNPLDTNNIRKIIESQLK
ncbi:DsbA family protein [Phocaeicola sp.]